VLGVGNGIPLRLGWRVRRTRLSADGLARLVGRVRRTRLSVDAFLRSCGALGEHALPFWVALSADGGWRDRRARPTCCGYLLGVALPVGVGALGEHALPFRVVLPVVVTFSGEMLRS
jgi:hypothetical protein